MQILVFLKKANRKFVVWGNTHLDLIGGEAEHTPFKDEGVSYHDAGRFHLVSLQVKGVALVALMNILHFLPA